ncbi:hypothetical protein HDU81_007004 [Chytriomyces hyalinus]|nr:hypothetical protein HDU81_007004 [Chytriomyces hyalinus]
MAGIPSKLEMLAADMEEARREASTLRKLFYQAMHEGQKDAQMHAEQFGDLMRMESLIRNSLEKEKERQEWAASNRICMNNYMNPKEGCTGVDEGTERHGPQSEAGGQKQLDLSLPTGSRLRKRLLYPAQVPE